MNLRQRLSFGFIVVASVPAVLMAALHSYIYLHDAEITIERNALRFIQGAAKEIDRQMQNVARDMAGFAIAGDPAENTPPDLEHQLAAYSYAYPYFREILWVDPQGLVLASSNSGHYGQPLATIHDHLDDDLALVLKQPAGTLHVSDFDDVSVQTRAAVTAGQAGSEALTLQLLLRSDDALGNAAGVLIATVTNQLFTEVLEDLQSSVPGAKPVALLNHRGELLLSSDPQAPLLRPHALAIRLATELDASETSLVQFEYNDTDEEVSVAETAGLGSNHLASWRLVMMQPEKYARYPVYRALLRALVLLAAIVIISGYLSLRLAHALVRPVESLALVAERIRDGDFTAQATVDNDDEVGRLALAFNAMSSALEHEREALRQSNLSLESSNQVLEER